MSNSNTFSKTNPFSSLHSKNSSSSSHYRQRVSSISKAPPKPPSAPPTAPPSLPQNNHININNNNNNNNNDHLRQQLHRYENMYKQTKNQLEVLKSQFRGQEKELKTFRSQKQAIDTNHSNIIGWQKKIAELEMERQTLIDKNGVFLQQKNTFLLQLAEQQQVNDEIKIEIDSKTAEIDKLESEMTASSQNYTQQLSKKDNKYKSIKAEYHSLNEEFKKKKQQNKLIKEELNAMAINVKELKQENLLLKDKFNKLFDEYNTLKTDHQQIQTQICMLCVICYIYFRLLFIIYILRICE